MKKPPSTDDLAAVFERAAKIVSGLPPDLRTAAFEKAVSVLLGEVPPLAGQAKPSSSRGGKTSLDATDRNGSHEETALDAIDRTAYPEIYKRTKVVDQCLIVLRAARDAANVEWLSVGDVAELLRDKFRIPGNAKAIGMALSRAGRLVDRRNSSRGYEYRLMAPGDDYLNSSEGDRSKSAPRSGSKKQKNAARAIVDEKKPAASRNQSRPGPTQLLENMVLEGFFDNPQNLPAVILYLVHKKAHRYTSGDIAPILTRMIRAGRLERERGNDGQYRYVRPTNDAYLEGIMKRRAEP